MAATNPVSLMMPGMAETMVGLSAVERRRRLAEMLQEQSMEPDQTQVISGWAIPNSPLSGAAKLAKAYAGSKMQESSDQRQIALLKALQGTYSGMFGSQPSTPAQSTATQAALSAPMPSSEDSYGQPSRDAGPTNTRAELLSRIIKAQPDLATTRRGPLQTEGMDPVTANLRYSADPSKYMENLYKSEEPSPQGRVAAEAGLPRGSPEYRKAMAAIVAKEGHIPPTQLRAGSIGLDPNNNVIGYNPPSIPGSMSTFQGGMGTGYQPAPGGTQSLYNEEAARKYADLQMRPPSSVQTPGNPSLMTGPQQFSYATGQMPPAPPGVAPVGVQPPAPAPIAPPNVATIQGMRSAVGDLPLNPPGEPASGMSSNNLTASGQPISPRIGGELQSETQRSEQTKVGGELGDYYGKAMTSAAKAGVSNRFIDNMDKAAQDLRTGKLAPAQSELIQWAQAIGIPVSKDEKNMAGNFQALNSIAINLAGKAQRESDAQPAAFQYLQTLKSMPDIMRSPEGFSRITAWMRDMNNYEIARLQALDQWRTSTGTSEGFQAHWATAQRNLPFVWNQRFGVDAAIAGARGQAPRSGVITPASNVPRTIRWDELR